VKAPSQLAIAKGLSGGNQQKLVIAKWLAADANVLMIDEPTRGVDVGAKAEIHALLRELAASGKAILVVSSDLPELRTIADRLIVMHEGRAVAENPARTEEETIMRQMTGV
jgi:ABC-type sugar transport system ATPase subunit